jgi:acyl dehydratase
VPELDRSRARDWPKGRYFDDFSVGQRFDHHWGRTVSETDSVLFSTLTLSFNPLYFNREYSAAHGHPQVVVNPLLVFGVVFGLTVEDLSEKGGAFLGVEDLVYHEPVYPGDTLTSASEVVAVRESRSHPGHGVVTWHTEGVNQRGERVIDFKRTNLIVRRPVP